MKKITIKTMASLLKRLAFDVKNVGAMFQVKLGRPMVSVLLMVCRSIGGKINKSIMKVIVTYCKRCYQLARSGGLPFLVIYLKAASTTLMQAGARGSLKDMTPLGCRISRTKSRKLPTIIPALHRAKLRSGDKFLYTFWLTLFSVYRVIEIPGIIKLRTIWSPSTMQPDILVEFQTFVRKVFVPLLMETLPDEPIVGALWEGAGDFVKSLRSKPFIISKSSPVVPSDIGTKVSILSTSPSGVVHAAYLWTIDPLYPFLKNWCQLTGNTWVINRMEAWTKGYSPEYRVHADRVGTLGKLSAKDEPAGKVRIFAIVDPWTQWLMKPLHEALFSLLGKLPMDGTHDQMRPLDLLKETMGSKPLFSFDLSAATDRLPLLIQKVLLAPFLTGWGAELWGIILTGRPYTIPGNTERSSLHPSELPPWDKEDVGTQPGLSVHGPIAIWYQCGQPMGALSSWAMLAFTHHALIQFSAYQCGQCNDGRNWFVDYAVLGDDVVIANQEVAAKYVETMARLGVSIGLHKSLISRVGLAMEFAKKFILQKVNVSAHSILEASVARHNLSAWLEYVRSHKMTLAEGLALLGYGYRVRGGLSKRLMSLPSRLRNYLLSYRGPSGPAPTTLKEFLLLKTLGTFYKSEERIVRLVELFVEREVKRLLDRLDSYKAVLAVAKDLGTVKRDREHYGTKIRDESRYTSHPDLYSHTAPFAVWQKLWYGEEAHTAKTGYPDCRLWRQYPEVIDSVNENVYREAFLDSVIEARDLRNLLEETTAATLTWAELERLWVLFDEFEDNLSNLPLPTHLYKRPGSIPRLGTDIMVLKRWHAYSKVFRSTK